MTLGQPTDAEVLRERLLADAGTDYGLTDERLEHFATQAREYVAGRRWSWTVVAHNMIRDRRPFHAL